MGLRTDYRIWVNDLALDMVRARFPDFGNGREEPDETVLQIYVEAQNLVRDWASEQLFILAKDKALAADPALKDRHYIARALLVRATAYLREHAHLRAALDDFETDMESKT